MNDYNPFVGTEVVSHGFYQEDQAKRINDAIKRLLAEACKSHPGPIIKHLGVDALGADKVVITLVAI